MTTLVTITQATIALMLRFLRPIAVSWRPDPLSIFIGLGLGVAVAVLIFFMVRSLVKTPETEPEAAPPPPVRWERSDLEKQYHASVVEFVETRHLARDLAPLSQLFVPPPILGPLPLPHPQKPPPLAMTRLAMLWPELAARVATAPLPAISVRNLLLNGRRVVLSSPPGTGKSTLLAYCAYLCAQAAPGGDFAFLQRHIPVLVHAADLRLGPDDDAEDSIAPLLRALHSSISGLAPLLARKAESGQILLLLDGWSEVSAESRVYILSWLRRFLARYIAATVFVATGTRGFEPLLNLEFTLSGLAPWRASHAHHLAQRWATNLRTPNAPSLDGYWRPQQTVLETTLRLWAQFSALPLAADHLPALLQAATSHFAAESATATLSDDDICRFWQSLAFASLQNEDLDLSQVLIDETAQETAGDATPAAQSAEVKAALRRSLQQAPFFAATASQSLRWASPVWRNHLAAAYISQDTHEHNLRKILRDPDRCDLLQHLAYFDSVVHLANWILDKGSLGPHYDDLFSLASWQSVSNENGHWRQQTLIRLGQIISRPEAADIQRLRAIATLPDCNSPGMLPLLHQLLHRSDPAIRQAAIAAIARFDPDVSVPLLSEMLQDGNADVRASAVHALGWIQHESARDQLLHVLIGNDDLLRYAAVDALARGGLEDWRVLQEAASDEDVRVRRAATRGLAAIDDAWAEELLQRMEANDEQLLVRSAASHALERRRQFRRQRPWYPTHAANLAWVVQWSAKRNQAVPGGAAAVTLLCEMLSTAPESPVRNAAARTLAHVAIPSEERNAVWACLWQATRTDASGAVREAAHASLAYLQRARGPE